MVGKVLDRSVAGKSSYDLPPRLFRQVLEPDLVAPFNSDLLAYDKTQFYEKEQSKRVFGHCVGHFWDNDKKQAVARDLGPVNVFCRSNVYRAASSAVESSDESANVLSWGEGAAPCAFVADEYRPERSEDGTESAQKTGQYPTSLKGQIESGSYVIPGQSPTDGNNQC